MSEIIGEFKHLPYDQRTDKTVLSPSSLMDLDISPMHFYDKFINKTPYEPTPAMKDGTMIHKAVLEPDTFMDQYAVLNPKEKYLVTVDDLVKRITELGGKGKGKKEVIIQELLTLDPTAPIWDVYEKSVTDLGKTILTSEKYKSCEEVVKAVKNHWWLGKLPQNKLNEIRGWYKHESGIYISFMIDSLFFTDKNQPIIIEVKKTRDASPRGFAKQIANNKYNIQASAYVDAVNKITGRNDTILCWVAIEDVKPYVIEVYSAETAALSAGHVKFNKLINKFLECREQGEWPAYTNGRVNPIHLPKWYYDQLDYEAEDELLFNEKQGD